MSASVMSSQTHESLSARGLPMELLEQVANEILTTKTLANFARTCSTAKEIVERNPLQFYLTDDLDDFKVIFRLYQNESSRNFIDTWPTDEDGGFLSPTAYEAVLTVERFDIFFHMVTSGWGFTYSDYRKVINHHFYPMLKERLRDRLVGFMLMPNYSTVPPECIIRGGTCHYDR
ncbi:hypothetical protein RRF57_001740 [Xylaria bambusicola]|uniref:F-box domain-containing protein n=1 Tax=Xylaria bambusicola TaxID=326684 RepID=A0AAN7UHG9_9PEZI